MAEVLNHRLTAVSLSRIGTRRRVSVKSVKLAQHPKARSVVKMNLTSLQADWNSRRSKLNHGWLGKTYPAKLGAVRRVLSGDITDADFLDRFLTEDFDQWEANRTELARLLDDFPSMMSPKNLLGEPPLAALPLEDRQWLGALAHALWWQRNEIEKLVVESRALLDRANEIYGQLKEIIGTSSSAELALLQNEAVRFEAFHRACSDLSAAISLFPHRVEAA